MVTGGAMVISSESAGTAFRREVVLEKLLSLESLLVWRRAGHT